MDSNIKHQSSKLQTFKLTNRTGRLVRLISLWFFLQVLLNVAVTLYLTVNPPLEPTTLFDRFDLTINTGINLALAVGFWKVRPWAWSTAVILVPLYWILHLWHMLVPAEGFLLWPFLLLDALVLAWLLGPTGRRVFSSPDNRFRRFSLLPHFMGALALYAALAPLIGLFVALAASLAVVVVGFTSRNPARKGGPKPKESTV